MAIIYCSWATGNDTTGTGTAVNPYKTITKASTSRAAGDEVRVAKSPDPTALTGTTAWTLNGTTVTGTGTLFTTELVIGDFISAPDGQWYEVITIGSDTSATLYKKYPSATASGHASQKLGVTDTGAAAATTTQVQVVSSSGTSSAFLYISGGWDLSTETQTGQTYFRQMHGTFSTRNGQGLYMTGKSYTNISRLHFLRYNNGIYYNASNNNTCTSPTCNSNNYGINYASSFNNICTTPTCNSNTYGIYYSASSNNFIYGTLSTTGNTSGAIYNSNGHNFIPEASLAESTKAAGFTNYANGCVYINDMGGQSYIYTDNGNIVSQNATAGGTGREWKFSPTNAIRNSVYPLWLPMARFAVASSGQVTVTAYFKKSGTGVAGALRCRYGQIAWSDATSDIIVNCPNDINRNQVTLQFTPTEAGVVEVEALAWYVSSTSQTVIVDDIAISQA